MDGPNVLDRIQKLEADVRKLRGELLDLAELFAICPNCSPSRDGEVKDDDVSDIVSRGWM